MFKSKGSVILIILAFIMVFFIWSCSNSVTKKENQSKSQEQIKMVKEKFKKKKEIIIGTSPDYPPYEFYLLEGDPTSDLVGLDVDIASEIAKNLDVKLKIKVYPFNKLFDILEAGEVDLLIAGINPSEKRKELAEFSKIYYKAIQNLLIRIENTGDITGLEDLRGKRVGVQTGTIQENMVKKMVVGAEFISEDSIQDLIGMLIKGDIDAIVVEEPVAEAYIARNKGIQSISCDVDAFDKQIGCAIAVKKGNLELLEFINGIITQLKEDNKIYEFIQNATMLNVKSLPEIDK